MADLIAEEYRTFESIKHTDENGVEFWYARDLQSVLQYAKWENFAKVIDRAMLACKNSGFDVSERFPEVRKSIKMPKFAEKQVIDYKLTRYACYLIVQNGDPRKEVIALGQTYFAIQTRRQELADAFNQLDENNKRLVVRGNIKQWNQLLREYPVERRRQCAVADSADSGDGIKRPNLSKRNAKRRQTGSPHRKRPRAAECHS
jgi:DNA-damage-inducible protein D